jgi:glycosyltransferase involved in cell wall biosynthesis
MKPLSLFYAETDLDRWLRKERLPWRLLARATGRSRRPGGQTRVFLNLVAGLNALGVPHRVNDFAHAQEHPEELCCVLGRRRLLESRSWTNPLLVGPCVFDHPLDSPRLFERFRIRRLLVPGEWMRRMCEPHWGRIVHAWPVGIDTGHWTPPEPDASRDIDVLVYDKVLWDRPTTVPRVLGPVLVELDRRGLRHVVVRYGRYEPDRYRALLRRSRLMVFLCEHETQGLAYQEALASGVPLLVWDAQSCWKDPTYYPHRVDFSPVSPVPYWDDRCGVRFDAPERFAPALDRLEARRVSGDLDPRGYVLENLTLEQCASAFVEHAAAAASAEDSRGARP